MKSGDRITRAVSVYYGTADTFPSKHGGSATVDMLEEIRNVVLWAGYAFSRDYKQGRGHYYAINDVNKSLRTGGPNRMKDCSRPPAGHASPVFPHDEGGRGCRFLYGTGKARA